MSPLWCKGISQFPHNSFLTYKSMLSGAHRDIELRPYFRGAMTGPHRISVYCWVGMCPLYLCRWHRLLYQHVLIGCHALKFLYIFIPRRWIYFFTLLWSAAWWLAQFSFATFFLFNAGDICSVFMKLLSLKKFPVFWLVFVPRVILALKELS